MLDYTLKKKEQNATTLNTVRRVTYDISGQPIIRLNDLNKHRAVSPVDEYFETKKEND
jgi:hypothetical protein